MVYNNVERKGQAQEGLRSRPGFRCASSQLALRPVTEAGEKQRPLVTLLVLNSGCGLSPILCARWLQIRVLCRFVFLLFNLRPPPRYFSNAHPEEEPCVM